MTTTEPARLTRSEIVELISVAEFTASIHASAVKPIDLPVFRALCAMALRCLDAEEELAKARGLLNEAINSRAPDYVEVRFPGWYGRAGAFLAQQQETDHIVDANK